MKPLPIELFRFGIEHEFAAIRNEVFCDFQNTTYEEFSRIITELPRHEEDSSSLRVGDLGIRLKRWYVEGLERFDEQGNFIRLDSKGFEIRTPLCTSIDSVVTTLRNDFVAWQSVASKYGYVSGATSFNPFAKEYVPNPPLNAWELAQFTKPEDHTAYLHMRTYGPDINFSHPDLSTEEVIEIGKKLTFYSPYIVPFSFSSPFYEGTIWEGLSCRTYYRTGMRPAALVFLDPSIPLIPTSPSLTDHAHMESEVGRIEFKAFDAIRDLELYRALTTLLVGMALSEKLTGRAITPDEGIHKKSALLGFSDEHIYATAHEILSVVVDVLPANMRKDIAPLERMLESRTTPAHEMIATYRATGSIMEAITLAI